MAKRGFSIGQALGDGFAVAGRRPLSVWVWGGIMMIPSFAPTLLLIDPMMNLSLDPSGAAWEDSDALTTFMIQSNLAHLLGLCLQVIAWAVLGAAVYRAVLRPASADRRPFALGLGMDEVRVGVSYLAVFVGAMVLVVVLLLLMAGIGVATWSRLTDAGQVGMIIAMTFATLLVLLLTYGRVCLIPAACVAQQNFSFEEGWRLGGGQTGKLALLTLLLWLVSIVVAVAAYLILVLAGIAFWMGLGLSMDWPRDPASFAELFPDDTRIWWLLGALSLPLIWAYGFLTALGLAPYASAVKQLTPAPAGDAPAPGGASDI